MEVLLQNGFELAFDESGIVDDFPTVNIVKLLGLSVHTNTSWAHHEHSESIWHPWSTSQVFLGVFKESFLVIFVLEYEHVVGKLNSEFCSSLDNLSVGEGNWISLSPKTPCSIRESFWWLFLTLYWKCVSNAGLEVSGTFELSCYWSQWNRCIWLDSPGGNFHNLVGVKSSDINFQVLMVVKSNDHIVEALSLGGIVVLELIDDELF